MCICVCLWVCVCVEGVCLSGCMSCVRETPPHTPWGRKTETGREGTVQVQARACSLSALCLYSDAQRERERERERFKSVPAA
jgi:hypothetical protein